MWQRLAVHAASVMVSSAVGLTSLGLGAFSVVAVSA